MPMHNLHLHRAKLANPIKMGCVIVLSFLVGALIPLAPFLFLQTRIESLIGAALVSPTFLFSVGAWRGRVVGRKFWRTGIETLLIGVSASLILYLMGLGRVFVWMTCTAPGRRMMMRSLI